MSNPTIVAAFIASNFSPEMTRGQRIWEAWNLTGVSSGAGTTVSFTPDFIQNIEAVVGCVTWTVAAGVVTVTLLDDITTLQASILVVGT